MRVLVVGTMPAAIGRAEDQLHAEGYDVVRCHEPGDSSFPCAGLIEGRVCPLEDGPVDVVVAARHRPWPRPSPFEDGVTCSLRQHVPLVVLGTALHPFEDWAVRGVDDDADLVAACEEAAAAPLERHGQVATAAAREVVEITGGNPEGTAATVRHQRGRLAVQLALPSAADGVRANVVANVLTALRQFDGYAPGIDISISNVEVGR